MPLDKIVDELLTPKTKRAVGRSRARVAEYDADIAALMRKLPTASVSAGKDDSASVDASADKLPEASKASWRDHVSAEHIMDDPRMAEMLKKLSEPNCDTVDVAEFLSWYKKPTRIPSATTKMRTRSPK